MIRIRSEQLFRIVVGGFIAYGVLFIFRTSFVIDGERFFSLFDDAMVSMRYARNLAAGNGLVWNPGGETIEGYTNFLWVIWMAVLHLVLPVAESKISLAVQLTSLAALVANLSVVRRLALRVSENSEPAALGAVFLTAFYYPLNNWSLQGMEVGVLALVTSYAVLRIVEAMGDDRFDVFPYVLLAGGTFIRPDATVLVLATGSFLVVADRARWKHHLLAAGGTLAVAVALQTGFRLLYFGDGYPNTYYLKVVGYPAFLRITRGAYVYLLFILRNHIIYFLLPLAALLFTRDRRVVFLAWVFAAQSAYSIYVGGDHWENFIVANRYLSIVMPLLFVLFALAVQSLSRWGLDTKRDAYGSLNPGAARFFLPALAGVLVVSFILTGTTLRGGQLSLLRRPMQVHDNRLMVEQGLLLREVTDDQATIAVVWAGAMPYFAHRTTIDLLGKADSVVAHAPVTVQQYHLDAARNAFGILPVDFPPARYYAFRPGNMKHDLGYSIGTLRPDVVAQIQPWWPALDNALAGYRPVEVLGLLTWYVREDSEHIRWEELSRVSRPAR